MIFKMTSSIFTSRVFLLLLLMQLAFCATSFPTPIQPDLTYQTGITNIISSSLTTSNNYTVPYNWNMATASLNASLAIPGMSYQFNSNENGWRQSITSLNASHLIMQVTVNNNNDPITNMRISFLVTYSQYLDINYVSLTFTSSQAINNYALFLPPTSCTLLDCRNQTTTISYNSKNNGKVLIFLAGYYVNSMGTNNTYDYQGISLDSQTNNGITSSFKLKITVFGDIQVNFVSFYYVAFQPDVINILTYRNIMYGRYYVGCYYHSSTCNASNPLTNGSFTTGSTFVTMSSPYNTQMFFYGLDRVIAYDQGNATVSFDTPTYGSPGSSIKVDFNFYGNTQNMFTMAFSGFTIQTFFCSNTPPMIYYSYNANTCTDNCNSGVTQYANATRYCQPCGIYCYMCNGTDTNCTACYSNQNRVVTTGGICSCDTNGGFYDDSTSLVCPKCSYTCQTCSGIGGGACLTCSSSSQRTFNLGSCVCNAGYYDNGAQTCSSCYYTCGTATCNGANNNKCLTCNAAKYRQILGNFTCACMSGYYDNSTSSEACSPCLYSCVSCSGTNTFCTACDTVIMLRNNSGNTCTCVAGYYDAGVPICKPCYSTCSTCNGPSKGNCLSCSSTFQRSLNSSTCICINGYYDLNDVCTLCDPYCLTCIGGTEFTCTSCSSSNFRTLDVNISACVCSPGYVESGVAACQPCSASCLTCITNSTNCNSCHNQTARYLSSGSCVCSSAGYIDVYLNGTCTSCYYSCATCSAISSTSCVTCTTNRTLSAGSCLCPSGFYDNGTPTCQPCASSCVNCTNGLTTSCTACNPLYLRYLSGTPAGSCLCSAGYYDSGALICAACSIKCLTCSSSSSCLSCDFVANRRNLSSGQCVCISGYFDAGAAVCSSCTSPCVTCNGSTTFCTGCASDRYLSSTNLCLCNSGLFLNSSSLCQACDYSCLTCSGTSITCLSCYSNSNRNLTGSTCPCQPGYFDNATIVCPSCYYTCSICISGVTCTQCALGSFRLLQANGSCVCSAGYYDDGMHPTCQSCDPRCLTCSYYSQCLSCNSTNFRTWESLTLSCPCNLGYFDNSVPLCSPCYYSCITCAGSNSNNCLTCQSLRVLNASGFCACQNSTYQYMNTCTPCALQCLTCSLTGTNCTSCYTGSYLSNNQCLCSPGYYLNGLNCSLCDIRCQTCSTSATTCLICNFTHSTILSGTSCVCPDRTYQTSTLVCAVCSFACLTCFNSTNSSCLSCDSTAFRSYNSTANSCLCISGYYDNNSLTCQLCSSPCLNCNGGSIYSCTSCIAGYTLIGSSCRTAVICTNYYYSGFCVSSCPNTTYPSTNICQTCSNNCLTCLSASVCSSCLSSFYLLKNGSCLGSCPNNTYASNNQCIVCPQNCSLCVMRSTLICITCLPSYYLTSNFQCSNCPNDQTHIIAESRCIACISPCLTCLNLTSNGCLSCQSGYIMFNGSCLSNCPGSYYLSAGSCLACPSTCLSCSYGICNTCVSGYYLSPIKICTKIGYFINSGIQTTCHPNCKTCTQNSFSSCIACNQYRGDSSSMAIGGYCDCWKGSIDLGNGTCDSKSYTALQKATQTLVSTTTATTYTSVLTGVMSMNLMGSMFTVTYQQLYGNFYYINASAVGQTDKVLQKYSQNSPNTYLHSMIGKQEDRNQDVFGRRLQQGELQQMQSLFMRGGQCQYLYDWAFFTFVIIVAAWILVIVLKCILLKFKNRQNQKKSTFYIILNKIINFLRQSFFIIIYLLTINEISFYGAASLKIQLTYFESLDYQKFAISIVILVYYFLYLLRMIVACTAYKDTKQQKKKFIVLFACFEKNKMKSALSRLFLPFIMLRSILISLCLVIFSYNPFIQIISSLTVFIISCLYSLCYCPYRFYIKIFVRLFQLLFTIQLVIITLSILKPEYSRLTPAIALIVMNYLQMGGFMGMSLAVLVNNFYGKKCCNKQQNIIAPLDPKQEDHFDVGSKSKKIAQETLEEIDQQSYNKNQIANSFKGNLNKQPQQHARKIKENIISQENMIENEGFSMDLDLSQDMYQNLGDIQGIQYRGRTITPHLEHKY